MAVPTSPIKNQMAVPTLDDPYRHINQVPKDVLESLAEAMEAHADEAENKGIKKKVIRAALEGLNSDSGPGAVVVDVGCGTGPVTRAIAAMPGVAKVIGIDPCAFFLDRARQMDTEGAVEYREGCCTRLDIPDGSVDLVVMLHVLSHVRAKDHLVALGEARRVLKDGGRILLKDSDLSSWSLTKGPTDPLTAPVETLLGAWSEGRYLCREFPSLLDQAGFVPEKLKIFHVLDDDEESFGFKYVMKRAIALHQRAGRCTPELSEALLEEAKRRVEAKQFQCLLTYGACVGYKPTRRLGYGS